MESIPKGDYIHRYQVFAVQLIFLECTVQLMEAFIAELIKIGTKDMKGIENKRD